MATDDEKTKRLRTIEEVFNKGNVDALDGITAPDIVYHVPPRPDVKGREAYKQYMADMMKAFSGFSFALHQYIFEGDADAGRWTIQGALTGQMPGSPIPPTGKQVTMTGILMTRLINGKAVEQWNYVDFLGFMQQLGVKP